LVASAILGDLTGYYGLAKDIDHQSDHSPILTQFSFGAETYKPPDKPNWSKIDWEKLCQHLVSATPQLHPTKVTIDDYLEKLYNCIQEGIIVSVHFRKQSIHNKSFWTNKCGESVQLARLLRRKYTESGLSCDKRAYSKACSAKSKLIKRTKNLHFREQV
jgi:hypothetical protein